MKKNELQEMKTSAVSMIDTMLGLPGDEEYIAGNLGAALEVVKNKGDIHDLDCIVQLEKLLGIHVSYDIFRYLEGYYGNLMELSQQEGMAADMMEHILAHIGVMRITKEKARQLLMKGWALDNILPPVQGQHCQIYKAGRFKPTDEVIYIPDYWRNGICHDCGVRDDIGHIISKMYTGQDFIRECRGNLELAEDLFSYCDWQHPSSALEADYAALDDIDMLEICGQTYAELFPKD